MKPVDMRAFKTAKRKGFKEELMRAGAPKYASHKFSFYCPDD